MCKPRCLATMKQQFKNSPAPPQTRAAASPHPGLCDRVSSSIKNEAPRENRLLHSLGPLGECRSAVGLLDASGAGNVGEGMSLRVKSHTDLQAAGASPSLGGGLHQALSMSSGSLGRGSRFGSAATPAMGEVKGQLVGRSRRPVRVVRPVSTSSSFLHINNLQGELVRKRKVRKKGELEITDSLWLFFWFFLLLNCRAPRAGRTGHLVPLVSVFGPSLTSITEQSRNRHVSSASASES